MEAINVYDFDKTLLPYDSTEAFFLWCLRRYPRAGLRGAAALPLLPLQAVGARSKTEVKEALYRFLPALPDARAEAETFWAARLSDVRPWYLQRRRPDDVVISASPEFLLRPAAEALGFCLIASRVDPNTGRACGRNNDGAEKVRRFRLEYPDAAVAEFYSDSRHDAPMARLAQRAFLIRHGEPRPWPGR